MLIYQLIILAGLLLVGGNLFLNLLIFRRPRRAPESDPARLPLVSILIPARNEEFRLPPCLDTLLKQDYPNLEWIVMDDHSSDRTADLVRERMSEEPRLRLAQSEALPEGWTGKAWACWQLSRLAKGDILLFTDADTHHEKNCVSDAVALLESKKGDLLSVWPRQIARTWSEILIIPFVHILMLFYLPHWMPSFMRNRSLGVANGQFMMFRRSGYEAVGGHEKVRSHMVEDVGLGREIKENGLRLLNANGSHLLSCRMYESFAEVWEGFTKNLRPGFEDNAAGFVTLGLVQLLLFVLPFVFLCLPLPAPVSCVVLAQIAMIFLLRGSVALFCRQPWLGVLFHPVGQTLALVIALNSWIQTARGKLTWKGRPYGAG